MTTAWRVRMRPRDTHDEHRAATPLELFFDLTFVVAIAQAASRLHHGLAEVHIADSLSTYPLVFFAVWWAWMNFTWFASAYDTDDGPYRVAVFVQMAGVLILAAGVPRAFDERDFTVVVAGYVVMRLALVAQWLRAAAGHPDGRTCALRYATGIFVCQIGWIVLLAAEGSVWAVGFALLAAAELLVPVWAERAGATAWHARHIAERYGLFTIIVLGESVLAATLAVQQAVDVGDSLGDLATVATGGLLTVFAMWWLYFDQPASRVVERVRESFGRRGSRGAFLWGYGHMVVFASAAAVGAGIAVSVDHATGRSHGLSDAGAGLVFTVPVALYVLSVWALHVRQKPPGPFRVTAAPAAAALVVAAS
ncbi:MAG: low temperature requirement protein A, partial [Acidimicrobiales bacterium]